MDAVHSTPRPPPSPPVPWVRANLPLVCIRWTQARPLLLSTLPPTHNDSPSAPPSYTASSTAPPAFALPPRSFSHLPPLYKQHFAPRCAPTPCTSMPALHLLTLAGLVHVASGHGQLNFPPSTRQGLPGKTWPGALSGQGSGGYCEQPLSENPHNQLNGACMLFSQPSVKQPGISMIPVGGATLNDAKVRYWLATGWCRLGDVGGLSWEYTTCYSTATTSM